MCWHQKSLKHTLRYYANTHRTFLPTVLQPLCLRYSLWTCVHARVCRYDFVGVLIMLGCVCVWAAVNICCLWIASDSRYQTRARRAPQTGRVVVGVVKARDGREDPRAFLWRRAEREGHVAKHHISWAVGLGGARFWISQGIVSLCALEGSLCFLSWG